MRVASLRTGAAVNLRNLETFLALADVLSFTQAARRLGKTQSAVSQAIRQLEEQFGTVLVNRAAGQVELTAAGRLLQGHAASVIEDMRHLASLMREQGGQRLQHLRFAMVDSFATAVGTTVISSLMSEAVNLSLWSDATPLLGPALQRGEVDIVVSNDPFDGASGLRRHELFREPFLLLLPPGVAWNPERPDLHRLARDLPMVGYRPGSHMGAQIEGRCSHLNVKVGRKVAAGSTEMLLAMVAAGIGWGSAPPLALVRSPERFAQIQVFPFPGEAEPLERHLFMLSRWGEIDDLVDRLAATSRQALHELLDGPVRRLLPGLHDRLVVVEGH